MQYNQNRTHIFVPDVSKLKRFPKPIKRSNDAQRGAEFRYLANNLLDAKDESTKLKYLGKLANWARANPAHAQKAADLAERRGHKDIAEFLKVK